MRSASQCAHLGRSYRPDVGSQVQRTSPTSQSPSQAAADADEALTGSSGAAELQGVLIGVHEWRQREGLG